jgi:hypothetical protein
MTTVWFEDREIGRNERQDGKADVVPATSGERLAHYERRYRQFATELSAIELTFSGRVIHRYTS